MAAVRINDLLRESALTPTGHLDPERVERYAAVLDQLPPVIVFGTEVGLLLVDGYHRVAAAQRLGRKTVKAEVRQGSRHDALRYAVDRAAEQGRGRLEAIEAIQRHSGQRWSPS